MSNNWLEQLMEDPTNRVDDTAWVIIHEPESVIGNGKRYGEVVFKTGEERGVIKIIWNDEFVFKHRSTLLVASTQNEDGRLRIYVSHKFVKIDLEKSYALAGIWHEIGHIHCGHFDENFNNEGMRESRYEALISGGVVKFELEADAFAARIVGKSKMIQFLQYCKAEGTGIC